ncbi:hypothetical protein NYO99_21280 [Pelomonas sp. UHG3]|uniref:Uncharacterized protein n=1 Tax=Roseateles hydrophilus TaxID=2975054 RepID=A0ACC6CGJ5_9BURK|nr:hypothetical protein [Pelomonas sp. UHG3]MCY4747512.1 hypothetical protein [Pelomonas sp. UHG3]
MKFWKFETPTAELLDAVLASGALPPSVPVAGLRDTHGKATSKLKPGDGVVLATLQGEEGKIIAFGKVRAGNSPIDQLAVRWVRASHGVHPTGSGLEHWRSKTAFEISAEPAERYGLQRFIDFHIKDSM